MNDKPQITLAMSNAHDNQLQRRKIEVLLDQAPVAISAGTIAAFICTLVFLQMADKFLISAWFCIYLLLSSIRYPMISRFNNAKITGKNYQQTLQLHLAISVIVGLLWSVLAIYLLSTLSADDSILVLLMIGGMIAGVVATNCVILAAYFAVSLPTAIPVVIYLLTDATPKTDVVGLLLGIFLVFMSYSAWKLNKLIVKALDLQFDNLQLLAALEKEKTQVTILNSNLEFDLARRKKAE